MHQHPLASSLPRHPATCAKSAPKLQRTRIEWRLRPRDPSRTSPTVASALKHWCFIMFYQWDNSVKNMIMPDNTDKTLAFYCHPGITLLMPDNTLPLPHWCFSLNLDISWGCDCAGHQSGVCLERCLDGNVAWKQEKINGYQRCRQTCCPLNVSNVSRCPWHLVISVPNLPIENSILVPAPIWAFVRFRRMKACKSCKPSPWFTAFNTNTFNIFLTLQRLSSKQSSRAWTPESMSYLGDRSVKWCEASACLRQASGVWTAHSATRTCRRPEPRCFRTISRG